MKFISEEIEIRIYKEPLRLKDEMKGIKKIIKLVKDKIMFKEKTKKFIAVFLAIMVLFTQGQVVYVAAQTLPTSPAVPSTPEEPVSTPDIPEDPDIPVDEPSTPDTPDAPELPEGMPVEESSDEYDYDRDWEGHKDWDDEEEENKDDSSVDEESNTQTESTVILVPVEENETGGQDDGGNVGDTTIDTGVADINGAIVTDANTNISSSASDSEGGITIVNTDNGSDSDNSGSVTIDNTDNTVQANSAEVVNNMGLGAVSGDNESSKNVGNTTINTGDVNTTGTIVTAVNTNIDGVTVNEFNIVDDHMGDYVLDFSTGCISGCGGDVAVENLGNGSESVNSGEVNLINTNNTSQTNDATITNDMVLYSNSGDNEADKNTAGDSTINTGDANVNANILNFANNNLAGDVIYAVVNIFGDLIGDIIMPDGSLFSCCGSDIAVTNSGNGSESVNAAEATQTNTDNINQFNTVDIDNNLIVDANTGDNETSDNTGGNSSVTTGDADVLAQVVNVANMNLVGGNWWLVIVNEAGNWVGKILGSPDDSNMAASSGIEFVVDENGDVAVSNSGNGSGSTNTGSVNQENTNNITQTNNANIVNNVDLTANTGDNSASKNTGGDSTISTGDANVVANIVNFVNNNIVGSGKLFVTMVNVFGSWMGDFVGPGYEKEADSDSGVGGVADTSSNEDNGGSSDNSGGSSGESQTNDSSTSVSISSSGSESGSGVLSLFIGNSNSSDNSGSDEESSDEEPAFVGGGNDVTAGDKVVNVNLAWLIIAIPLVGILIIGRKRFAFARILPRINKGNV